MSELKLYDLNCIRCGGRLEYGGGIYTCAYCGAAYQKQEAEDSAQKLSAILDEQKREKVANLRSLLWKESHEEYVSNREVERLSREILTYLPDDFYANFYLSVCSKNKNALGMFLSGVDVDARYDDIPVLLDYILKGLKAHWAIAVGNFIERAYKDSDLKLYHTYRTKFERENQKIEDCVYEPAFPRDVFVAYSSKDMVEVEELVSVLEEELTCFVAARNLRHGSGAQDNYENAIHTAIDSCEVVVFLSSDNSRSIKCDAYRELDYVQKHCKDKPRVEYLIKNYSGRPSERFFKNFFCGLEYCLTAKDVAERVSAVIMGGTAEKEEQPVKEITVISAEDNAKAFESEEKKQAKGDKNGEIELTEGDFNGNIVCRSCKKICVSTAKFCPDCGSNKFFTTYGEYLESKIKYCAECGTKNGVHDRFCIECGCSDFVPTKEQYKALKAKREEEERVKKQQEEKERIRQEEQRLLHEREQARINELKQIYDLEGGELRKYKGRQREVILPPEVKSIAANAFDHRSDITSVVIPDGVKRIGAYAFYKCTSLESIIIPDSVTAISYSAFFGCSALKKIVFPEKIKLIEYNMCRDCASLASIKIPSGVVNIANSAFCGCSRLETVSIPDSVKNIGDFAFRDCTALKSVNFGKNVASVGGFAFYGCTNLTDIKIPQSVTVLGSSAFYGCKQITSAEIPAGVTSVGAKVFEGCLNLEKIYCRAKKPRFGLPGGWDKDWLGYAPNARVIWDKE